MTTVRALFAAPGARRALSVARTGSVEIALSTAAAYVRLGQDWVLLAARSVPFGPLSVCVPGLAELRFKPGLAVQVVDTHLGLGDATISLERLRERTLPVPAPPAVSGDLKVAAAVDAADAELPAPPPSLAGGIRALTRDDLPVAVADLAGRGPGLTPAGDDVLAGYAAAKFVLDRRSAARPGSLRLFPRAAGRCSPIGLAYLRCAERGELPDLAARLLYAVCAGSIADARVACTELRSWGASSGTAIGWGITAAFRHDSLGRRTRASIPGHPIPAPVR